MFNQFLYLLWDWDELGVGLLLATTEREKLPSLLDNFKALNWWCKDDPEELEEVFQKLHGVLSELMKQTDADLLNDNSNGKYPLGPDLYGVYFQITKLY